MGGEPAGWGRVWSVKAEPRPELVAGRYEIGPSIGRGGMGEVRRAHDVRLGREVAIKFLRADLAAEPGVRGRFDDEARAAARLGHPNAVTVFDFGEHRGDPYIVMESLPGHTLADALADGPLPEDRVRRIALDVLGALGAAHDLGIVHRDVKPANILFATDGTAKVADFGIAKSTEGLDHTATGQVIGTAAYLAPERLEGRPAVPQSDLYALGVVLYEALAGRKPFTGDTPVALAHAVHSSVPTPLGEVRPGIDAALAAAIDRAMRRAPEQRFATAGDMARSLAGGAPAPPTPAGDADATAALGEATQLVGAPSTQQLPAGGGAAPVAPSHRWAPERGNRTTWMVLGAVAAVVLVVLVLALASGDGADPASPAPTDPSVAPSPTGSLPQPLDDALRRLEESVRR